MITLDFRFVVWPEAPVDAAGYFYRELVPQVREALDSAGPWADIPEMSEALDAVAVVFPNGDHTHSAWRLAAVQELARESAPKRVNGIVGDNDEAIAETTDWLASASGITGQLLSVQTG